MLLYGLTLNFTLKKAENQYLILWQRTMHLWGRLKVPKEANKETLRIQIMRADGTSLQN